MWVPSVLVTLTGTTLDSPPRVQTALATVQPSLRDATNSLFLLNAQFLI
jgi:hypothetical protein